MLSVLRGTDPGSGRDAKLVALPRAAPPCPAESGSPSVVVASSKLGQGNGLHCFPLCVLVHTCSHMQINVAHMNTFRKQTSFPTEICLAAADRSLWISSSSMVIACINANGVRSSAEIFHVFIPINIPMCKMSRPRKALCSEAASLA